MDFKTGVTLFKSKFADNDSISMTSLLKNIVAHSTRHSFRLKINNQPTEVRFANLLYGTFTTMTVINPPDKKLANRTFVQPIKKFLSLAFS